MGYEYISNIKSKFLQKSLSFLVHAINLFQFKHYTFLIFWSMNIYAPLFYIIIVAVQIVLLKNLQKSIYINEYIIVFILLYK